MKKNHFAFVLFLSVLSTPALSGWVEIEKFDDGTRAFVDKATAQRLVDNVQMLHLVRWGEPQIEEGLPPYLSTVVRTSYDCLAKREKYLDSTSYTGPMGTGTQVLVEEDESGKWFSISEDSMEEKLWKIACAIN